MNATDLDIDDPFRYLMYIAFEETIPIGMHIDLTYRCDLACTHCYLESRGRREMSVEEYESVFEDMAALGTFYLLFSGGDVFVRPDAMDILRAAARYRFDMKLITHAMSIDDRRADELAAMGMRSVGVSVYHADPQIHDAVTRRRGSFERTIAAIRRLVARNIAVQIKCSVFHVNEGAESVMPALAESLGAELQISPAMRGGNGGTDKLLALNMELSNKANVYDCVYSQVSQVSDLPNRPPERRTCMAGHASAYLGPDGTVQPCLEYEVSAGNIRETSFQEIWETSPLLNNLRDIRRSSFTGCTSCDNYSFCGLCPAVAHRETGSPTGSAPSKCRESTAIRLSIERREAMPSGQEFGGDLTNLIG
jgi:radical SAM protein with 4Fe4S-binding SPASM domain